MSFRTPLGRVRGLGSARDGTGNWWAQRLTAIALVPLTLWFVISVIVYAGADYETTVAWLGSPVPAGLMMLLVVASFYHGALGLQEVIEDYVHSELVKVAVLLVMKGAMIVLALTALLAVLLVLTQA